MHAGLRLAPALAGLAAAALVHAQGPDELWSMTTSMQMEGMQVPGMTQQVCMKKGQTSAERMAPDKNCKATDVRTVGNTTTWKMTCTGAQAMSGTGEITRTRDTMSGRLQMRSRDGDMTVVYTGKLAGSCDAQQQQAAMQAQASAAMAQGQAATAQLCRDAVDKYQTMLFEAQGSPCASYRGEYCAHVKKTGQSMRTPAGYRSAMQKQGMQGEGWERAAEHCQVQTAPIAAAACKSAVGGRDWAFVADYCPEDTQKLAAEHCAGREYTVAMSSEYKAICAKYAGKFAQPQRAAAKPAAAPTQSDAVTEGVKEGVRGLRKLFGN